MHLLRVLPLVFLLPLAAEAAITIGPGPLIGTDKRGDDWFQEFQDWSHTDLRALDQNNDHHLFSGEEFDSNPSRDLVAFYHRTENGNVYFRVDFFDIGFNHQDWAVDVYVAIDCAPGGQQWLPDFSDTRLEDGKGWEICVGVYNTAAASVYDAAFENITTGNFLGAYWHGELDALEFGIPSSVLTAAGWDGTSPLRFWVATTRDGTDGGDGELPGSDLVDTIGGSLQRQSPDDQNVGILSGDGIASTSSAGRAKYAAIAHANQSVATVAGTQGHIFKPRPDLDLFPGFIRTIDTHEMLGVPLNMHLSGSLLSSLLWAEQNPADPDFPDRDGPTFVSRLQAFHASGVASIIGGVYAEHIMPYFEGEVNRASIRAFNDLASHLFDLSAADMKVMHVPERVMPLKQAPFDDILAGGYTATYLDEVTHLHWWFYPDEQNNPGWDDAKYGRWAGGGGNDEEPYHHKLHRIHGVLTFMINDREDQSKFGNDDGGMMRDTRYTLLQKALAPDSSQITIVFDDWEAFAGNSFASDTPNNNADQWHRTIRWAANKPWIDIKNLKDVVDWAQNDPTWVVEHTITEDLPSQTYEWLKRASEHSYDNWYYGSDLEESFADRRPMVWPDGGVPDGIKNYGDIHTPGTLVHDAWQHVAAMPQGQLRRLAEWTYSAMIYETAWHDEDANPDQYQSRNYQTTFDRVDPDLGIESYEDTTFDPISYWALRLHGHIRKVGIMADAARWVATVNSGAQGPETITESKDVDDDTHHEYILKNNRVYLCFERFGARLVYAFVYDPDLQDARQVIGVPVSNPSEEHDGEGSDNNRCSAFKDRYATGPGDSRYVDMDYAATPPVRGEDSWEFRSADGNIVKQIRLPAGRDLATATYTLDPSVGTLYLRHGLGPNQIDLLFNGAKNLTTRSGSHHYGLANSQGGEAYAVRGLNSSINQGDLPGAGYLNRELPLIEQVEVESTATTFSTSLAFSLATAQDLDADGLANDLEAAAGADFTNPDTDGDGMPDGFESTHGLITNDPGDATTDPDRDGRSNLQEFLASTDPTDPTSTFRQATFTTDHQAGTFTISWPSVPDVTYHIESTTDLKTTWKPVVDSSTTATSTTSSHQLPIPTSKAFYRVTVGATP
jgi:hypothetical protein